MDKYARLWTVSWSTRMYVQPDPFDLTVFMTACIKDVGRTCELE